MLWITLPTRTPPVETVSTSGQAHSRCPGIGRAESQSIIWPLRLDGVPNGSAQGFHYERTGGNALRIGFSSGLVAGYCVVLFGWVAYTNLVNLRDLEGALRCRSLSFSRR
jgi:hypothetical protein